MLTDTRICFRITYRSLERETAVENRFYGIFYSLAYSSKNVSFFPCFLSLNILCIGKISEAVADNIDYQPLPLRFSFCLTLFGIPNVTSHSNLSRPSCGGPCKQ